MKNRTVPIFTIFIMLFCFLAGCAVTSVQYLGLPSDMSRIPSDSARVYIISTAGMFSSGSKVNFNDRLLGFLSHKAYFVVDTASDIVEINTIFGGRREEVCFAVELGKEYYVVYNGHEFYKVNASHGKKLTSKFSRAKVK